MSELLFQTSPKYKFRGNAVYKGDKGLEFYIYPNADILPGRFDYFFYYTMYYKDGTTRKVCQKTPELNYILRRNSEVILYSCLLHERPDHKYSPVKYYDLEMLIFEKENWNFQKSTLRKTYREQDHGLIVTMDLSPFKNFLTDPTGLSNDF